ncbi:hypothetical protein K4F52_000900 [Lecanicillium sp. MT-2017a]|nr:hypothetical protein K4F52_000900 [Lecanicillium sp. MT-2017a]
MTEGLSLPKPANARGSRSWASPTHHDFYIDDFEFSSGEALPKLKLHCLTLGKPAVDATGRTTNAVLIMHGTGGSGANFIQDIFAGELFETGQPLDSSKHFIIMRDGIGHGQSSKPSNGLRASFPRYGYHDMVRADHALLTQFLGVNHLRLVMGTSMGGMQSWMWASLYPDFMDAAMPLAALPVQMAGRNRMSRKMIMDAIETDPAYLQGNYTSQPVHGLTSALYTLTWMSSVPLQWQKQVPTLAEADAFLDARIKAALENTDANDLLYQIRASTDYNPAPLLDRIKVPLLAVNSADDQVNPPELRILEQTVESLPTASCIVLPISDETRGHGTHTVAKLWKHYLVDLLDRSQPSQSVNYRIAMQIS